MRKTIGILLATLSVAILGMAMNQSFINSIKQEKYFEHLNPEKKKNIITKWLMTSDRWRYGDLYGLCFLPAYKVALEPFTEYTVPNHHKPTNRLLYIIGDSFLADKMLDGAFDKFDKVVFIDRRFPSDYIKLDSTKQNYLIVEIAERNLNYYEQARKNQKKLPNNEVSNNQLTQPQAKENQPEKTPIFERLNKIFFNKDLSRNIELLLFDNKLATIFKEQKAKINYSLYEKVPKEVSISTDKRRLFLNSTVDTNFIESSFKAVENKKVSHIAKLLDEDYNYYKTIGFKMVFLSVIPNSVTIYDNKRMKYNHLLERVEKEVSFPKISILNSFLSAEGNLFYVSDSHWNPKGLDRWVRETNKVLNTNIP